MLSIYKHLSCSICGNTTDDLQLIKSTIKEFSYNYYIPNDKCAHSEDDRYCVLVKWDDFVTNPEKYIVESFQQNVNML